MVDLSLPAALPEFEAHTPVASEHVRERVIALFGALAITAVAAWYGTQWTSLPSTISLEQVATTAYTEPSFLPSGVDPLTEISLEARAALVYDLNGGRVLFGRSPDEIMPLASLTKLMTALVAREVLADTPTVTISAESILREGDSGLTAGEVWATEDLISFMLITSSNDAADALAVASLGRSEFVARMNTLSEELELTASWNDPTGLDINAETPGGAGSARDVARLLAHLTLHDAEVLQGTTQPTQDFQTDTLFHHAVNTNALTGTVPGLVGSKTGYTPLAGGNLGILFDPGPGTPIAIVVLGSSRDGRFTDVEKLTKATIAHIASGWYEARLRSEMTP